MDESTIRNTEMLLDLKSMNEKQRLKEFKSTQKDIKSKDLPVKSKAIAKCKEEKSYFIDGGCFIPLITSTLPKKKALEVPTVALDFLAEYFHNNAVKVDDGTDHHSQLNVIFDILKASFEKDGNFDFMQSFTEILKFKEERKVKKIKPKKGEPIPPEEPFIEDPEIVHVRDCALKCFYRIIRSFLVIPPTAQIEIKKAFSSIEGLYRNLFSFMREFLIDISQHETMQNAVYALSSLVFTLRYNTGAVDAFITESGEDNGKDDVDQLLKSVSELSLSNVEEKEKIPKKSLLLILQTLSKSEPLSLYCIQAQELICYQANGLLLLSKEENKEFTISELDRCLKGLHTIAEAAAAAAAAAAHQKPVKEVKKDDKGKKGADHGHAHVEKKPVELETVKVEPIRSNACTVKLLCKIITEIAQKNKDAIDATAAHKIGVIASQLLVSHPLWELVRDEHSKPPLDELVFDVVEELCIMVGSIGFISPENRHALVESGCLQSLITVMQQSRPIITGVEELSPGKAAAAAAEKEKAHAGKGKGKADPHNAHATTSSTAAPELSERNLKKLMDLRRVCEKAILNLSTDPKAETISTEPKRWASASKYSTDESVFLPHGDTHKYSFFAELLDLATFLNDNDLATRGVRMMAAILIGCEEPSVFIRKLNMDHPIALTLTAFCKVRGVTISAGIHSSLDQLPDVSSEPITPPKEVDFLISADHTEPLYLAYSIMETMLLPAVADCVETVKTFATEEHVKIISTLLELLGPTHATALPTQRIAEFQAKLFDPRSYSWRVKESESVSESVFVRPILLRTLSLSAAADAAYRQYEASDAIVPPLPCTPVPLSKSPCADAALYVCKFSSDAVFAILSKHSLYKELSSNLTVVPIPNMAEYSVAAVDGSDVSKVDQRLEESVLIAALEYVVAVGSCGVIGLAAALEAIADTGFKSINNVATPAKAYGMKALSLYLKSIAGDDSSSRFDNLIWTRPKLFDEVFPSTTETQFSSVVEVVNRPILWPFITISGGLISIFADPKSTVQSTELAVSAIMKLTNFGIQNSHSQPLLCDVLSAVFLSVGGGVALTGLLGRFGNLTAEFAADVQRHVEYLFNRGHERQSFWHEWNESHKEPVVLDPKTGKPIVKKDDKKAKETKVDKKVDPKAIPPIIIVPEIQWNLESLDEFPDPNHGPTANFWLKLLNISAENLFEVSQSATLLTSAVQGGLQSLGQLLIRRGVSLDAVDGAGLSAIMYSLIYNDEVITQDLIDSGADVNALDGDNNSVLKYALLSLTPEDIKKFLKCHIGYNTSSDGKLSNVEVFGSPRYLPLLLNTQKANPPRSPPAVDVNLRDKYGFSPLMTAMGQGDLVLKLGGYKIHILSAAYNDVSYPLPTIHGVVRSLINAGSWLKACSIRGVVPMHIAAARGDIEMIQLFASKNADLNPIDVDGYLPLHFLVACCPANAIAVFDELIAMATHRPLEAMVYEDYRSGQTLEYKNKIELEKYIDERFLNAVIPQGIAKVRLSYGDLLSTRTNDNLNLLQLCMCAHVVLKSDSKIDSLLKFDKSDRIDLSLHIADCARKTDGGEDMFSNFNHYGMSVLHSACILLEGIVPQRELTDKEKRSKRVKTYPSKEVNLLEWIKTASNFDVNGWFQWTGETDLKADNWNAMLLAIKFDNPNLIRFCMDNGFDVTASGVLFLHHLLAIDSSISNETTELIINICAAQPSYKRLLSEPYDLVGDASETPEEGLFSMRRPLTEAVRKGKVQLIESLVRCSKVDLNAIDELSQMTAFHEACLQTGGNLLDVIRAFAAGSDRLDMLASAVPDGSNAVTAAMFSDRLDVLQELLVMRKNDVLECLLSEDDSTPSLLLQLERENIELAKKMGFTLKEQEVSKGPDTWQGADESKGEESLLPEKADETDTGASPDETSEKNGQEVITDAAQPLKEAISDTEKEDIRSKLIKNNALLKIILPVVIESGIITESNHAHSIFFSGQLPIDL